MILQKCYLSPSQEGAEILIPEIKAAPVLCQQHQQTRGWFKWSSSAKKIRTIDVDQATCNRCFTHGVTTNTLLLVFDLLSSGLKIACQRSPTQLWGWAIFQAGLSIFSLNVFVSLWPNIHLINSLWVDIKDTNNMSGEMMSSKCIHTNATHWDRSNKLKHITRKWLNYDVINEEASFPK